MPERGFYRSPTVKGYATPTNAPCYVSSGDNLLHLIPAGTGSTEVIIPVATSTSGARFAAGTAALVSGSATIATGLTSVLSFTATLISTGTTATGVTEVCFPFVSSITTGSVVLQGAYQTSADFTQASAAGTGSFYWIAIGM